MTGSRASPPLRAAGHDVFDGVAIEPTDASFRAAADAATAGGFDSFVGVGGGSTIDTAKAANLYATPRTSSTT